ncbi:uncharacterized protein LOC143431314 isoform X2 [Xylocopa sonorina]|uniref:uncharacterized protein LOC143431314 isoform X2 n=1 Tax=Xylocopa sonorina TaxID=1818115 RepID=UPI00403B04F6
MSRVTILLLLLCFNAGLSYGTECAFGNKNILSRLIDSCPGLLDSADKSYCCHDIENGAVYCCDYAEFVFKTSWILLIVIVTVVILVLMLLLCILCLCCSCCPWYRRRHRGTVYGSKNLVVRIIQSSVTVPQPNPQYTNTAYATSSTEISDPPTYSEVAYEKQAPYNPNYASPVQNNVK